MAEKMGAPRAIALCECFLGAVDFQQGDWTRAEETLRQSVERYHEIAAASGEALACQRLGAVLTAMGRFDEAMEIFERGIRVTEGSQMRAHCQVRLYACMAQNRLSAQDREGAHYFLQQGLRTLERHGACVTCNALLYPVAVRIHLADGNLKEADAFGRLLETAAARYGSRGWSAMAAHMCGLIQHHQGRLDEAAAALRHAMDVFRSMGQPYDAALAAVDQVQVLMQRNKPGDGPEARRLLGEAEQTFRRVGAEPDARRAADLLLSVV